MSPFLTVLLMALVVPALAIVFQTIASLRGR